VVRLRAVVVLVMMVVTAMVLVMMVVVTHRRVRAGGRGRCRGLGERHRSKAREQCGDE
jgi:hypothetical protein